MTSAHDQLRWMIETVALALGEKLLTKMAFTGGCTTGLLITDEVTKEFVRYTNDVDLIVEVVGYADWAALQAQLIERGFSLNPEDTVICRMRLGELMVDFMPDDPAVLGFSNRWYKQAFAKAVDYPLMHNLDIRLLTAPYFIATKLEAFRGRGKNDPLTSHDLEDILNIVDGRSILLEELKCAEENVRRYIAEEIACLLDHEEIDYLIQGTVPGDSERAEIIFERLESIKALSPA